MSELDQEQRQEKPEDRNVNMNQNSPEILTNTIYTPAFLRQQIGRLMRVEFLIGTNNKGKVEGAKQAFEKFYENVEVLGISVDSGVSDEPVNDEIYQGASNRVNNLIKYAEDNKVEADFFIGVESGITNKLGKWCIIQIAVIKDKNGYESFGTGPAFPVPDKYVKKIIDTDLGIVMDKIFNGNGLKNEKGGIAHLTKDVVTRYDLTREAFIMAITEFINGEIWRD